MLPRKVIGTPAPAMTASRQVSMTSRISTTPMIACTALEKTLASFSCTSTASSVSTEACTPLGMGKLSMARRTWATVATVSAPGALYRDMLTPLANGLPSKLTKVRTLSLDRSRRTSAKSPRRTTRPDFICWIGSRRISSTVVNRPARLIEAGVRPSRISPSGRSMLPARMASLTAFMLRLTALRRMGSTSTRPTSSRAPETSTLRSEPTRSRRSLTSRAVSPRTASPTLP